MGHRKLSIQSYKSKPTLHWGIFTAVMWLTQAEVVVLVMLGLLWHVAAVQACTGCFSSGMQSTKCMPLHCGFLRLLACNQSSIILSLTLGHMIPCAYTHTLTHKLLCMWKSHPAHSKRPALCKQIAEGRDRMEVKAWLIVLCIYDSCTCSRYHQL